MCINSGECLNNTIVTNQCLLPKQNNTLINQVGHRQSLAVKQETRNTLTLTTAKYPTDGIIPYDTETIIMIVQLPCFTAI